MAWLVAVSGRGCRWGRWCYPPSMRAGRHPIPSSSMLHRYHSVLCIALSCMSSIWLITGHSFRYGTMISIGDLCNLVAGENPQNAFWNLSTGTLDPMMAWFDNLWMLHQLNLVLDGFGFVVSDVQMLNDILISFIVPVSKFAYVGVMNWTLFSVTLSRQNKQVASCEIKKPNPIW